MRISKIETGKRLRSLMAESGITVREIQEELDLDSPQAVYKWLNGKALPSVGNLLTLGCLFDRSVEQLLVAENANEIKEKRKLWDKKHTKVYYSYLFHGNRNIDSLHLLIVDTKTDWSPEPAPAHDKKRTAVPWRK